MKSTIFLFIFGLLIFTACSDHHQEKKGELQQWMQENGKVKALSTTAMINDLVKQVGGNHVETMVLVHGELDPHTYQLVKGDDEKLSRADIVFYNGLGLEHGPSLKQCLRTHSGAVCLGDHIEQMHPDLVIRIDGQKDPHIWMDAALWSKSIPSIVEALSKKDPDHASEFTANGQKLAAEMEALHLQLKEILHSVPSHKRYLVTSHDAFSYFSRAYLADENEIMTEEWKKRFVAPEGLAPESQLSAANIKEIISHAKAHNIHLLFPESNVSRDSIKKIVQAGREQGLNLEISCCHLYSDALGAPGSEAETYFKMILYNAKTLAGHMNANGHGKELDATGS